MFNIIPLIADKAIEKQHISLVFLSGFLGNADEWFEIADNLYKHFIAKDISLNFLGCNIENVAINSDLPAISQALSRQLNQNNINKYILIAYSLGGRIALHNIIEQSKTKSKSNIQLTDKPAELVGAIIESAHFGLQTEHEKQMRWQQDVAWANRFADESLEIVLNDWYQQPVFSDLSADQRQELIAIKCQQNGKNLNKTILATSLSKQKYLLADLLKIQIPVLYLTGEFDSKFTQLALNNNLFNQPNWQHVVIGESGHNIHKYQTDEYTKHLISFIDRCIA